LLLAETLEVPPPLEQAAAPAARRVAAQASSAMPARRLLVWFNWEILSISIYLIAFSDVGKARPISPRPTT
jgi:hypothetical protein